VTKTGVMSMSEIERRVEATRVDPDYAELTFDAKAIAAGRHRVLVGRIWDELGQLQIQFLRDQGLRPRDRFLDVGCGAFRAGRHLVDYLDPGHYYGIDIGHDVMRAGYDHELTAEQRTRLPTSNLRATDRFDADFGVTYDMAIAQSVFTHINLNRVRLCLHRVAKVMRPGGRFFVTFNELPPRTSVDRIKQGMYTERNVFWYYRRDMRWAARETPWTFRYVGDWGHPRGQRMLEFTRDGA
jgi:SAM-dependent methyltransferase